MMERVTHVKPEMKLFWVVRSLLVGWPRLRVPERWEIGNGEGPVFFWLLEVRCPVD